MQDVQVKLNPGFP